jgi:hypothetical protein
MQATVNLAIFISVMSFFAPIALLLPARAARDTQVNGAGQRNIPWLPSWQAQRFFRL